MFVQNLADLHPYERNAHEEEKLRLFNFWQENLGRAKDEARRMHLERDGLKSNWNAWADRELEKLKPQEYRSLVARELKRLA
ncbi:hypothetical protein QYE80_13450 [Pseudomonas tohonis]|uniref:hypothetical protein n=1 Tax=Pseudomonas sp. zfem005 TaxID=3078200 RepID=UPI000395F4C1|nr:hypothetical protein [Pseudomonas sp. zfem005]EQM72082.1 hypothetical protein L682_00350 [Pseudomonas alcaligenes OT 69]MDN4145995.1 hypothetical protein [Pseudomonas tohonis]MDU9415329.1 hypothetical protein [Pseudomonas sp. zfem005]